MLLFQMIHGQTHKLIKKTNSTFIKSSKWKAISTASVSKHLLLINRDNVTKMSSYGASGWLILVFRVALPNYKSCLLLLLFIFALNLDFTISVCTVFTKFPTAIKTSSTPQKLTCKKYISHYICNDRYDSPFE